MSSTLGELDELIKGEYEMAVQTINLEDKNADETFKGVPYGMAQLSDEEFVLAFELALNGDPARGIPARPNMMAMLAVEDTGDGREALRRYVELRNAGHRSIYAARPAAPSVF